MSDTKTKKKNKGGRPRSSDPSRSRSLAIPDSIWLKIESRAESTGESRSEIVSAILGRSGLLRGF